MVHCHPNAKLTPRGRAQVFEAVEAGMTVTAACLAFGVSRRCYYRWWPRWLASRDDGLFDRSSRPHHAPCQLTGWEVAQIVRLRLERGWGPDRIGAWLQLNPSTVHRVINRLGLFSEKARPEPSRRYEHREPAGLLHLAVKKLGQIGDGPGHRAHGDRTRRSRGVGWEYLYIAIDDCTRLVYCELLGEETGSTATGFLLRALRWLRDQGIRVQRLLTDNGSCFKSKLLNRACRRLAIKHIYTRPYALRPTARSSAGSEPPSASACTSRSFILPRGGPPPFDASCCTTTNSAPTLPFTGSRLAAGYSKRRPERHQRSGRTDLDQTTVTSG